MYTYIVNLQQGEYIGNFAPKHLNMQFQNENSPTCVNFTLVRPASLVYPWLVYSHFEPLAQLNSAQKILQPGPTPEDN
ncbi:hypothetical protein QG37_06662 [Candidozyma auris]|uniref:Uncharacterized protein n=1 Tax=Candidozyma auris TaxID=498019 RepID=A0A0L0NS29_CANAR|nr:hypothetical protein QG37_06662 [[Candida] auris]